MPPEMYEWVNKQAKVLGKSAVVVDMLAVGCNYAGVCHPNLADAGLLVERNWQNNGRCPSKKFVRLWVKRVASH